MLSLLDATVPYIDKFKGIRISTRPDCIDEEVLSILKAYKVTSIELGAQSMDDYVLTANNRGHSSTDVYNASKLIKDYGFSLGLQMMTGLYMSNAAKDIETAKRFIEINPDTVRIYPTIVMKHTELERLYNNGEYLAVDLESSVDICSKLLLMFNEAQIQVIRLGLHHSDSLSCDMVAGPYHPAFRELCESKILFDKLTAMLNGIDKSKAITVHINPSCISKLIGNKKVNLTKLKDLGYNIKILQDKSVKEMDIVINYEG